VFRIFVVTIVFASRCDELEPGVWNSEMGNESMLAGPRHRSLPFKRNAHSILHQEEDAGVCQ
jgi:hypothetical protein